MIGDGYAVESEAEVEMSREQDRRLDFRRRMAYGACPICHHCGYAIQSIDEAGMVINWAGAPGETKLFHTKPCLTSALELMSIRACTPKRLPLDVAASRLIASLVRAERLMARSLACESLSAQLGTLPTT